MALTRFDLCSKKRMQPVMDRNVPGHYATSNVLPFHFF